jgi:hypothetical protein
LTSNIWCGLAKEDYLSVVFYFVTDDWELEKHIFDMRLIDCSHSGVNIAERMLQVISKYNMISKVFAITLDNASAKASAMIELTPHLVPYVSSSSIASTTRNLNPSVGFVSFVSFWENRWKIHNFRPPELADRNYPDFCRPLVGLRKLLR